MAARSSPASRPRRAVPSRRRRRSPLLPRASRALPYSPGSSAHEPAARALPPRRGLLRRMRQRGPAGDAAHVHSPFGGQGPNLGIGDAMDLGWKLAAVVSGRAPEAPLDTYTAERRPIVARVLEWTRAQIALMRPEPQARALRHLPRPTGVGRPARPPGRNRRLGVRRRGRGERRGRPRRRPAAVVRSAGPRRALVRTGRVLVTRAESRVRGWVPPIPGPPPIPW